MFAFTCSLTGVAMFRCGTGGARSIVPEGAVEEFTIKEIIDSPRAFMESRAKGLQRVEDRVYEEKSHEGLRVDTVVDGKLVSVRSEKHGDYTTIYTVIICRENKVFSDRYDIRNCRYYHPTGNYFKKAKFSVNGNRADFSLDSLSKRRVLAQVGFHYDLYGNSVLDDSGRPIYFICDGHRIQARNKKRSLICHEDGIPVVVEDGKAVEYPQ